VQLVPITTEVVSSYPVRGEVYSIQRYVIKFISDLRQVGGFFWVLCFSFTKKTDRHDITEILLKVTLITINQPTSILNTFHALSVWPTTDHVLIHSNHDMLVNSYENCCFRFFPYLIYVYNITQIYLLNWFNRLWKIQLTNWYKIYCQ